MTIPTQLKILAGNPGKRPLNMNEPQPKKETPDCPLWFEGDAKYEWWRVVPELERLGLLTCVDGAILEAYCLVYAELMADAKAGKSLKSTLVSQLRALASELGLSPVARTKLGKNTVDPELFVL